MLACGHDREPFGSQVCEHLRICRTPWISFVRWYTGHGMGMELLCNACADERQNGQPIAAEHVCQECFEYTTTEVGELAGVRGKPEIRIRSESFNFALRETPLPKEAGKIIDASPIVQDGRSLWLLLAQDGLISQFDADAGQLKRLATVSLVPEPDHEPWSGHVLKRHLHAPPAGDFAAVVNDYGRYGQIIDLQSGKVTLTLDGGDYHPETVPFSFAFAQAKGRLVAIHRTAWNRLDVSDPSDGTLRITNGE